MKASRQARVAGLGGQRVKHREDDQHARRSAARGAEQMGKDVQLGMRSFQRFPPNEPRLLASSSVSDRTDRV
jgi:hypothetical protein